MNSTNTSQKDDSCPETSEGSVRWWTITETDGCFHDDIAKASLYAPSNAVCPITPNGYTKW